MSFGYWFCFSRKGRTGGGGWVNLKGGNSMAISGLSFRKYIGWHWAGCFCPPMHKQAEKAVLSPPISSREALFPVYTNGCQPRAMTIASH